MKKYRVIKDCSCEGYLHELTNYPRPGLVEKKLKCGDIVELEKSWSNFYGCYLRVIKDGVKYDIFPIEDVVDFLNEFLKMDPDCANALMFHREKCNDLVANHPTIQVHQYKGDEFPKVGLLGLLNGMLGIREDGMGPLCVEIDENGKIDEFRKTE